MADAMDTLKNILGDDAEDKIKNVLGSFSQSDERQLPAVNTESLDQLMQLKSVVDGITSNRNDPRTNLLMSLKPYMRNGRQNSIDSAIKILGLTNLTKLFRR